MDRTVSRPLCGIICPPFFECLKIPASRNSRAHVLKSQARHPSTSFRLTFFAASSPSCEIGKAKTKKVVQIQSQPTREFPLSLARFKTFSSLFFHGLSLRCDLLVLHGKSPKNQKFPSPLPILRGKKTTTLIPQSFFFHMAQSHFSLLFLPAYLIMHLPPSFSTLLMNSIVSTFPLA